jgi:multicomponent Na+:H+ antiporter subunit C
MTPAVLYGLSGALLVAIGLAGAIASQSLVRRILGFNVLGTGAFVIIIAFARRVAGPVPDPVSHALVLTGIVVTVSATAVALALAVRLHDDEDGRHE